MSEKSPLDSRFQGKPYEKDPSFDDKWEVIFHRTIKDFSEDATLKLYLDQASEELVKESPGQKLTMEQFLKEWNKSSKESRLLALREKRKQIVSELIIDYYTRAYRKIDKAWKISDPSLQLPLIKEVKKYIDSIESEYFGDYSDISDLTIQSGILRIARGENIRQIDLVHAIIKDRDPRRTELQNRTREASEALKWKISTEVYMAGVMSVEYEEIDSGKRQAVADMVAAGIAVHSVVVPVYRIRKMKVRNKAGKMEEVKPSEPFVGTKAELEKQLVWSLRSSGYIFDTALQVFISATRQAVEQSIHTVALSTFEQYQKTSWIQDTRENRAKFEQARAQMITEAQKMLDPKYTHEAQKELLESMSKKIAMIAGPMLSMSLETVFWWVFFSAYHRNTQDLANMGAWVAEVAFFRAWSKAGKFIPAPPILKPFMPMLGGMTLAVVGKLWGSWLGMDKAFWRAFPDREDYSEKNGWKEGNSITGHILTAAPVNAFYDAKQIDVRIGKREGTDIFIPFTNGKIMTIGSMDIGRSTIDMNTPPWEYMGEWIERDRQKWNIQVEKYQEWLTVQVLNLFRQYDEGKNIFEASNIVAQSKDTNYEGTKKEILRNRLIKLFPHFDPEGADYNKQPINDIIRQALEYVSIKPESRRNQLMTFFIEGQIDMFMNLNNRNLKRYKLQTEKEASFTSEIADRFAQEFKDQNVSQYIHQIFGYSNGITTTPSRIINKKRLVNSSSLDQIPKGAKTIESMPSGVWIEKEVLGTKSKQWIEGWEHKTFRSIIDSETLVKDRMLKEIFAWGKDISIGEVFYKLLNQTVEIKRIKEFATNVAQTDRAQKWNSWFLDTIGIE